jgi:hypothetical protein
MELCKGLWYDNVSKQFGNSSSSENVVIGYSLA